MPHKDYQMKLAYMRARYRRKREEIDAQNRAWKATPEGRVSVNATTRKWRARNPEKMADARKRWDETHPEAKREAVRRRRARRRQLADTCTAADLAARIAYYGYRCWVCRSPYEEIDHVKPIAKGGAHIAANLRPICVVCNRRKRSTWPFDPSMIQRTA